MFVERLCSAIESDVYPEDLVEGVFGVKMGDDLGCIVFHAWIALIKHGFASREDIVSAMVEGSLPLFFETLVRANDVSHYTHEMASRDLFSSISWDGDMLDRIGGKACVDVA